MFLEFLGRVIGVEVLYTVVAIVLAVLIRKAYAKKEPERVAAAQAELTKLMAEKHA